MRMISVVLAPEWALDRVGALDVTLTCTGEPGAGEPLFGIHDVTIFKPFTDLRRDFTAEDALGEVPLCREREERGYLRNSLFGAGRALSGPVTLRWSLRLSPAGRNPVFDLGSEEGGMNGSGMTFMPFFPAGEYEYRLSWDMANMPQGAVGAWAYGEGSVQVRGDGDTLTQTFYACGLLDRVVSGQFGFYWFKKDFFLSAAADTARIFRYEQAFFGDEGEKYTVFVRHADGEPRPGGTAYRRSYMCVYGTDEKLTADWIKFLFAHEMVHNWVHLNDEPFGTCTWYVEGMAEFYSAVLPWRLGAVTREELLRELNKRAEQFFGNPKRHLPNEEVGKHLMADREMTRVPYGRGFFYLTHADAMIRRATGGQKSLDDAVRALNRRFAADPKAGNGAWLEVYGALVGADTARAEFESMRRGDDITPETLCWEGAVRAVPGVGETPVWRFLPGD